MNLSGAILGPILLAASVVTNVAASQQAPIIQPGAPGEPSRTLPANTAPRLTPPSPDDVAFMQGMIMHHNQAVQMTALIPSHTTNQAIRELGAKISSSQSDEMKFMANWLRARNLPTQMPMPEAMPGMPDMDMNGNPMPTMPGMLTPAQMAALAAAHGPAFDRLFLTGMIQHHTGALTMVDKLFHAAGAGQEANLFTFATDVDNGQRAEIRIMQSLLAPNPAPTFKEKP
jgi:uncharacterized protein (DUF305 family)